MDETKGWSVEKIYEAGESKMRDGNYQKAISYFQKLESRYPNASYAAQAQLEIAFAYYKRQEPASSAAAADRFISLHPNHPNLDYAYYIKGLAMFNQRGIVQSSPARKLVIATHKPCGRHLPCSKNWSHAFPPAVMKPMLPNG